MRKTRYDKKTGLYLPETVRPKNKGYGEAGASWSKRAVKGFNAPSGSAHEDIDFHFVLLHNADTVAREQPRHERELLEPVEVVHAGGVAGPFVGRPERETIRPKNKGYGEAGASWSKRAVKGFNAPSGSAHEDIDFHNFTMRQRARMLYMAAPVAIFPVVYNRDVPRPEPVGVAIRSASIRCTRRE